MSSEDGQQQQASSSGRKLQHKARKEASSESRDRSEGRLKFIPTSSLHTRRLHLPMCIQYACITSTTSPHFTSLHFISSLIVQC